MADADGDQRMDQAEYREDVAFRSQDAFPGTNTPPQTSGDGSPVANPAVPHNATSVSASTSGAVAGKGNRLVHQASGYTWHREEDAPGYIWRNKKAQEEYARSMELIADKDRIIGRRYGDIGLFEASKRT